jgi:hypothetical protein
LLPYQNLAIDLQTFQQKLAQSEYNWSETHWVCIMKTTANDPTKLTCDLPLLSSQGWENILVEQFQHPSGEGKTHYGDEHAICLSLAPRPVHFLQIKEACNNNLSN